jgi:hypothetical protein
VRDGGFSMGPDPRRIEDHIFEARTPQEIAFCEKEGYEQVAAGSDRHNNLLAHLYNAEDMEPDGIGGESGRAPLPASVEDALLSHRGALAHLGLPSAQIDVFMDPLEAALRSRGE